MRYKNGGCRWKRSSENRPHSHILHYYHSHYQCAFLLSPHSLSHLVGLLKFKGFFFCWTCIIIFFAALTLTSASPVPIDTNEVSARDAQVRCFGCLLIYSLANFLLNMQAPPCPPFTCTWGLERASTPKINQGHAYNYSPVKLSESVNSYPTDSLWISFFPSSLYFYGAPSKCSFPHSLFLYRIEIEHLFCRLPKVFGGNWLVEFSLWLNRLVPRLPHLPRS